MARFVMSCVRGICTKRTRRQEEDEQGRTDTPLRETSTRGGSMDEGGVWNRPEDRYKRENTTADVAPEEEDKVTM